MIKTLIIDDEPLARQLLETYASQIPTLEVIATCSSPLEAMPYLQAQQIDLLLLDIQMPQVSGISFLESLPHYPHVIFTTAYSDYALKGYELNIIDYLLKPFSFERFLKAIHKIPSTTSLQPEKEQPPLTKKYISLKTDGKTVRLLPHEIIYVEGLKEYVSFYTQEERIITLASMKELETTLPQQFIRVHKSYIVNANHVKAMTGNQLEIKEGTLVPIGKTYKEEVKHLLFER